MSLRALLVDDEPAILRMVTRMLEQLGVRVEVANDGAQALRMAEAGGYDLILLDEQMPTMPGHKVASAIRALGGAPAAVPIVLVSGGNAPDGRAECAAAAIDGFLCKPVRKPDLLALLARLRGSAPPPQPEEPATPALSDAPGAFDEAAVLAATSSSRSQFLEFTELFIAQSRLTIERMRAGVERDDAPLLQRYAHRMSGAAAMIGARRLRELTERLESEPKPAPRCRVLIDEIEREASEVARRMAAFGDTLR